MPATAAAQHRISRLAQLTAVHRAFHWLHLHQPRLRQWQTELTRIPAPTFHESARAAWFLDRFRELGLSNPHIDPAGNALAELSPVIEPSSGHSESVQKPSPSTPCILLSAHLDTVFSSGAPVLLTEDPDSPRIHAPGICDNAAGLTALLAIAAALRYAQITPPIPILFAANVCEEGEGDLRGMRHLFERSPWAGRITAAIALEGGGSSAVVTRALGSLRLNITVTGPGGHSWADAGAPNPILILSHAITRMAAFDLPENTTFSPGQISGGTSINSIPESATVLIDLRSTSSAALVETATELQAILHRTLTAFSPQKTAYAPPSVHVKIIGNRPAAALAADSPILHTLRAVDRHLALRTEERLGSTDANIPLSLNIPAIALGAGGTGGGIHTQQEWYDPTGRETALRRILLTLLDTVETAATAADLP